MKGARMDALVVGVLILSAGTVVESSRHEKANFVKRYDAGESGSSTLPRSEVSVSPIGLAAR